MEQRKKNNQQTLVPVIAVLILLGVGVGGGILINIYNRQNSSNEDTSQTQSELSTVTLPDNIPPESLIDNSSVNNSLDPILGRYNGSGQVLSNFFQFPNIEIVLQNNGNFTLLAQNLDLQSTQNPQLQINNRYPVMTLNSSGMARVSQDGTLLLEFNEFIIQLFIDGSPVEDQNRSIIFDEIAKSYNVQIPNVSPNTKLELNTIYYETSNNSVTMINNPAIENQIHFNFSGSRAN